MPMHEHTPADDRFTPRDSVDALLSSWAQRRPDLDFSPVALIARLARIRTHIDLALEHVFDEHGLGAANFAVLVTLARVDDGGGVTQRRLMDELGLTSGTMSVRVDRMAHAGLVVRGTDPDSKRNSLISLTPQGRELADRIIPAHLDNETRLLAALSDDDRDVLAGLLRKLLIEFEGSTPPQDVPCQLGLTLAPAHHTITVRHSVGLPATPGLLVRGIHAAGPAAQAGVRVGDVLLRADGRVLRSIADLHAALAGATASGHLPLRLARGADEHTVTVPLGRAGAPGGGTGAPAGRTTIGQHYV